MRGIATAALLAALMVVGAPAQAAPPDGGYVALGDSFSAGSGVLPVAANAAVAPGCVQSTRNYPRLVQRALAHPVFADETCGGAVTESMTQPQRPLPELGLPALTGQNGPQFDALRPDTALVTLGIGLNDIGFRELYTTCLAPWPRGTFCRHRFTAGGIDVIRRRIDALRPKLRAVLEGIRARSPRARILTVGYPRILPPDTSRCWPRMPYASGDAPWLEGIGRELNRALRETTVAFGAEFVDVEAASLGHDACQPRASVRWVEPVIPSGMFAPVHPGAPGERAMADEILKLLRAVP